MRRWEKGVLIGEVDLPIDFIDWLRGEIEHARNITNKVDSRSKLIDWLCPHARLTTLLEVQSAYK